MNEIDILKELEKLDDDIEPGFLSELKQQTPDELHSRIMSSIRMEAMNSHSTEELGIGLETINNEKDTKVVELKPRFRFNYRKYATLTTAAAILVVVFVGGAKELLRQNVTPDSISPKHRIISNAKTNDSDSIADTKDMLRADKTTENKLGGTGSTAATVDNGKTEFGKTAGDSSKQNTTLANNNVAGKSIAAAAVAPDKTTATAPEYNKVAKVGNTHKNTTKTNEDEDSLSISTSKKASSKGIIVATTTPIPNTTISNSAEGKNTENGTTTDPNNKFTNNPSNLAAANGDEYKDSSNSSIKAITDELKTASLENIVNYELNLNANQNDIVQYVNDKGTKLAENVYELKLTQYNELNQLLIKNSIVPKKINEIEGNAQSVIVKLILN
jgi:hypothetical protein